MNRRMIIRYSRPNVHEPQPWPIGLEEQPVPGLEDATSWAVTSGLGPDDGAVLVGFGSPGHGQDFTGIQVYPDAAADQPATVTGMTATFSSDGGFFEWNIPIAELSVHDSAAAEVQSAEPTADLHTEQEG